MQIDIITLFPEMFKGPLTESILRRAQDKCLVNINVHQLRNWAINRRGQVDDKPYGGGAGMVMRVDVAFNALREVCSSKKVGSQKISNFQFPISNKIQNPKSQKLTKLKANEAKPYIVLPTPSGKKFDQARARRLAKKKHSVFLCPHYEGYDHRVESLVDEKISIGDYVLTGGELPVAVMIDAVVRLVPGVINKESLKEESFSEQRRGAPMWAPEKGWPPSISAGRHRAAPTKQYYEYPQYTRPEVFELEVGGRKTKKRVPKVLLSGNHAEIAKWREKMAK